jgi:hypothetical protein
LIEKRELRLMLFREFVGFRTVRSFNDIDVLKLHAEEASDVRFVIGDEDERAGGAQAATDGGAGGVTTA